MKKKIFIAIGLIGVIGIGIVLYIMFKPHRDVQSSPVDYQITASALANESLKDATAANSKYLAEDGDSKIIAISGVVASMDYDFNNNLVVLLKNKEDDAGVKCTFMKSTNKMTLPAKQPNPYWVSLFKSIVNIFIIFNSRRIEIPNAI